jgi:CRP/FNR family transcriptional regulator, cyclic AMP receptor protein
MSSTLSEQKKVEFDPKKFLATIGEGRKVVSFRKKQTIFTQGDAADAIFYIQRGKIRLTVVSKAGKEATLGILGDRDFFGEGALAGQSLRMGSATALTDCELLRIDKKAMVAALHREHTLRRRSGGPTLQLQRKAAGTDSPPAGSFRQGRRA